MASACVSPWRQPVRWLIALLILDFLVDAVTTDYVRFIKQTNRTRMISQQKLGAFEMITRPETICPGTSKLACWRVQLSTASKVGRRGCRDSNRQH
jgi:hypothetical protein